MIETPASSTATAWYVFGVAAVDESLARLDRISLVEAGGLAALVREVPLAEYGEDVLPERLNDREWLERNALEHEGVLQAASAVTAVVPLRFGTIYRDLHEIERMLEQRRAELESTLARVRGHVELGVKAWIDRGRLAEGLAAADEPASGGSGAAYLRRRQREQEAARDISARLATLAEEAHARLLELAVDGVSNRPQPRELTGRDETMLLNGAYLVPADDDRLREEVARLADEQRELGIEYEVTGPWPPHNFVGEQP